MVSHPGLDKRMTPLDQRQLTDVGVGGVALAQSHRVPERSVNMPLSRGMWTLEDTNSAQADCELPYEGSRHGAVRCTTRIPTESRRAKAFIAEAGGIRGLARLLHCRAAAGYDLFG